MKPTRLAVFALLVLTLMSAAGCQRQPPAKEKLVIASPIGLSKLLASVIVDKRFIEQRYGAGIAVEYRVIPSGTVINEGVVAGEIDVAVLPTTHALVGVIEGVPYRIYSGYANSVYSLCVLGDRIGSLRDFTPDDKIAIPSFGGTNHLKLARLAAEQLGSPSALNPMLVEMAQPDAIQALTTGGVAGTFMSFPNNYAQQACEGVRVLYESAFDEVTTELLTVATKDLHDNHRALYDAVAAATRDAVGYIRENPDEVAGMLAEEYKVDPAKMRGWLAALNFHTVPVGVEDTLKLMIEMDLLGEVPEPLPELYYEGVMAGEP